MKALLMHSKRACRIMVCNIHDVPDFFHLMVGSCGEIPHAIIGVSLLTTHALAKAVSIAFFIALCIIFVIAKRDHSLIWSVFRRRSCNRLSIYRSGDLRHYCSACWVWCELIDLKRPMS